MTTKFATVFGTALFTALPAFADKAAVLDTYADIALAKYQDSLSTAQTLLAAVNTLTEAPSPCARRTSTCGSGVCEPSARVITWRSSSGVRPEARIVPA